MHIAIFETDHFEGAYPVIRAFDVNQTRITIFTYESAYRQFLFLFNGQMDRYVWIVKSQKESKNHFIWRMVKAVKEENISLIYFNTIANNYPSYVTAMMMMKARKIVTIHDINAHFRPLLSVNFRRQIRQWGRWLLVHTAKEFNVVGQPMLEQLSRRLSHEKKVYCVPGAVFEMEQRDSRLFSPEQIKIVIPGSVDSRRRNYDEVFLLLKQANELSVPLVIYLLGGISMEFGKDILARCLEYSRNLSNLIFYPVNIVDQPEFDKVMIASDFVWIPSRIRTNLTDGIEEIYGETVSSGSIFEVIKHAKPFIVPASLQIDQFLVSSCVRYSRIIEITEFLSKIREQPELYRNLSKKAFSNSSQYRVQNIRDRNPGLFSML